jgi:hypothetical protein
MTTIPNFTAAEYDASRGYRLTQNTTSTRFNLHNLRPAPFIFNITSRDSHCDEVISTLFRTDVHIISSVILQTGNYDGGSDHDKFYGIIPKFVWMD